MTLQELKKMARWGIAKWCDKLPQDGDYSEPELITDRWAGNGRTPQDGDHAVIMIFHNRNEKRASEALKKLVDVIDKYDSGSPLWWHSGAKGVMPLKNAKAALAEPARNCDVGTADDWVSRFNIVCERCSGSDCDHRLFKDEEVCDCFARWLRLPYEEGVKVE